MGTASLLSAAAIESALQTRWLGRTLEFHTEIGSTNERLALLARQGAPAGTLVVADLQTAGRGRLGRQWVTPPGTALLHSVLYRPDWPPEQATWLTMITALAARDAIFKVANVKINLKWPNDLIIGDDPYHKVGGILLDAAFASNALEYLIVGMGINVNLTAAQLPDGVTPPTSLLLVAGQRVSRITLLTTLLTELEHRYELAETGISPHEEWQASLINLNQPVVISTPNNAPWDGIARGTDKWGRLLVETAAGERVAVAAGDVSLRSPGDKMT